MPTSKPVKQSAVLAYRRRKQGLQIVLVTSLDTQRWVLPKGHVENGMTPQASAAQEAYEEAWIEGVVDANCLGTYDYNKTELKGGGLRRVEVYPMAVTRVRRDWPERKMRRRKWMRIGDAIAAVDEKQLKKILVLFAKDSANG